MFRISIIGWGEGDNGDEQIRGSYTSWGEGLVLRYKMVVLFDEVGYKTLAVELVSEHKLFVPVS